MKTKQTFDWRPRFDERSKQYPILSTIAIRRRRSYTWRCSMHLDQGREGACTGFAVSHEMMARPAEVKGISNLTAYKLYKQAQKLDQWPGESYEGSSVLGAMKAAVLQGYYREYRWAFDENDIALAVGYRGPVIMGTNWHEGMMTPDSNGLIRPTGKAVGGHAYLIRGYDHKRGLYRIHNSWGSSWGKDGDCFIESYDLVYLISEHGEACIPTARLK